MEGIDNNRMEWKASRRKILRGFRSFAHAGVIHQKMGIIETFRNIIYTLFVLCIAYGFFAVFIPRVTSYREDNSGSC